MPIQNNKEQISVSSKLSGREIQIFKLIAEGKTNPKIAVELSISPHTVKKHRENLLYKLGASNTAKMIANAISKGLL
ncbi:MAG: two-component transcriptional regulator, LuxR family [Mucilaginibacter sp.]|nr:two-component transcriptional regulator, LuxR family [Mucilaginibacter sp.]